MDRLFIVGFINGHYDQRDVDKINRYLCENGEDSEREITKIKMMPNGEVFVIVTE